MLSILTQTHWERGEGLKETDSGIYSKGVSLTLENECKLKRFKICVVYPRVRPF